jgi:phage baseplate assembly protein W
MNRETGYELDTVAHVAQSIADILTTPLGSRVMRRDYGSALPELIDHPFNTATKLRAYNAIVVALMNWEPRIRVTRVSLAQLSRTGTTVLDLELSWVDTNEPLNLSVPLAFGAVS